MLSSYSSRLSPTLSPSYYPVPPWVRRTHLLWSPGQKPGARLGGDQSSPRCFRAIVRKTSSLPCKNPRAMKSILTSSLLFLFLARCTDPGTKRTATDLLVGNWENAETGFIVSFDKNETYSAQFGADTAFFSRYKLVSLRDQDRLLIYDSAVTHEYRFQFLEPDQLALSQVFPTSFVPEKDNSAVFHRLK